MKRLFYIISAALLLAACSEPFDLDTKTADKVYLCVEAPLTNMPGTQTIRLTESIDYQATTEIPAVSGASVKISDGTNTYDFTEELYRPGYYSSPEGFFCSKGKTYRLKIQCTLSNGKEGTYESITSMEEDGFDIEKVDYKYLGNVADSTWVMCIWGKDKPQTNYFLISTAVNGVASPTTSLLERSMIMPDTFFNNSKVSGYPIAFLYQNAQQYKKYGPCAKFLEKGDIISMIVYTMTKDYYDFIMALSNSASAMSIPIIASQPANIPTNITGGDAMGYFAICPVSIASCMVDDPFRTELK